MVRVLTLVAGLWIGWQVIRPVFIVGSLGDVGSGSLLFFMMDGIALILLSATAYHLLRKRPRSGSRSWR